MGRIPVARTCWQWLDSFVSCRVKSFIYSPGRRASVRTWVGQWATTSLPPRTIRNIRSVPFTQSNWGTNLSAISLAINCKVPAATRCTGKFYCRDVDALKVSLLIKEICLVTRLVVDVWDDSGHEEPVVYHGYTLTSKLRLRGVLQTINQYAFKTSKYPVIISVENRCKLARNHKIMAQMMKDIFQGK